MKDSDLKAQIDAAKSYEALFVPALFGKWATKVADTAQIKSGQRALDVACGTGVLSREVASRTGPTGYVAAVDPSPGMLAVGKDLAPEVDWTQGVAEALPFADDSFDTVVSQFGLMFFSDRHLAISEMMRVLIPGGRLVVAVWDSLANTPAYAADVALLERIAGTRAAVALRAPFVLGDLRTLGVLFTDAGVSKIDITTHPGTAQFPSLPVMVEADLRGWLPVMGVVLTGQQIGRIMQEADDVLGSFVTDEGRVVFESPAHFVTAIKV